MIKIQGYVYDSPAHYVKNEPSRCRGGMCPYFNVATFIERDDKTQMDVAKCKQCSFKRANTGSFPVQ